MELNFVETKILKVLRERTECRGSQSYFEIKEILIDCEEMTFFFHVDFDIDSDDKISEFNIIDSEIQFADFEAKINSDYLTKLQNSINKTTL